MPSRLRGLAGSAALRGALWITLIALLTTGFALTLQYVQMTRLLGGQIQAAVDDEAAGLLGRYRSQGLPGVVAAVERQQQLPRVNQFFYLLAAPDGSRITGNLVSWPGEIEGPGYHTFRTDVLGAGGVVQRRAVEARAILLGGGFRLLVGSLPEEPLVLRDQYLTALLWSFLATGALGLFLGFLHSRRGLNFVDSASAAGQRFLSGNLSERLPGSGRGDEYDRLAKTINRFFEEVERLLGSLRAATDGLAHDLKTPLTRLRARLELADIEGASRERLSVVVAESRQDLDAMLKLIDDILGLARAEATATSSFTPSRLDAIVREALELFQPVAEEKGIILEARTSPVAVSGARTLLAQMVTNLLDNAVKYTPPGGRIDISLLREGTSARLTVTDSGPGIAEEHRELALTRFARLDPSRSAPGSGIGLSIVAAAARVHRARLRLFDNQPGLGVEITFPGAKAAAEARA